MKKLADILRDSGKQRELRIIVSLKEEDFTGLNSTVITEAKKRTVGRHDAYKHQPHFAGGEYHGHCDLEDGNQVSWTITGNRLHSNKFPADNKIPRDAKQAVADVLGVSADILEAYTAYDEVEKNEVILIELKNQRKASRLRDILNSIND